MLLSFHPGAMKASGPPVPLGLQGWEAGIRVCPGRFGRSAGGACIPGMPCVTLRDNTERPETIGVGANVLAGADGHPMMKKAKLMMQHGGGWKSPFWDSKSRMHIVDSLFRGEEK